MTPRTEQLRKVNGMLRLTAEDLGYRAVLSTLDVLEALDVSNPQTFKRALSAYREIAVKLGKGKPAAQRTSLLSDIERLELPERCFEDVLRERRARKVDPLDDLDDLDNEEVDEPEEERDACECRCVRCLAGNHQRCLDEGNECGQDDSEMWLAQHPEDLGDGDEELRALAIRERTRIFERTGWDPAKATVQDCMNFLRLEQLDRKIKRDANTRTFLGAVARLQRGGENVNLFDFIEE